VRCLDHVRALCAPPTSAADACQIGSFLSRTERNKLTRARIDIMTPRRRWANPSFQGRGSISKVLPRAPNGPCRRSRPLSAVDEDQ